MTESYKITDPEAEVNPELFFITCHSTRKELVWELVNCSCAVLGCVMAATKALVGAGKKLPTPSAKQEHPELANTGPVGNTGPAADRTSVVCTV